MPIDAESSALSPTLVANPDTRFGVAFLDTKLRKYSVNGEVLMDKSTGELYFRRKEDGKLVSFNQDYRDLYDQMLNINMVKTLNAKFTAPVKKANSAFIVSLNFDLGAINNEEQVVVGESTPLELDDKTAEDTDLKSSIIFRVSQETTGFVAKISTRAADKVAVEYLTKAYNERVPSDTHTTMNAKVTYKVIVTDTKTATVLPNDIEGTGYVRLNEPTLVDFSTDVKETLESLGNDPDVEYCVVITSIDPYKLSYMLTPGNYDGQVKAVADELRYADGKIVLTTANVITFIDYIYHLYILPSETVNAAVDVPYFLNLMDKMNSAKSNPSFIVSEKQPNVEDWRQGSVWAEQIVDIDPMAGTESQTRALTDIEFIAARVNGVGDAYTNISSDIRDKSSLVITPADAGTLE